MSAKPVVYFIDDSATMREVIKIAFRREELDVITCHDASSAIDMMEHSAPDVVISDVIMPGRDGYEVCQYIKQHPRYAQTPVILMSGVVNKGVAERAFAVHANELIRKPFQPQDLIARVRHLLSVPAMESVPALQEQQNANAVLSSIFSGPVPARAGYGQPRIPGGPVPVPPRSTPPNMPNNMPGSVPNNTPRPSAPSIAATVAAAMQPPVVAPPVSIPGAQITGSTQLSVPPPAPGRVPAPPLPGNGSDAGRMRLEILRLHSQIKKLEAELSAEREYSKALEQHVTSLQEVD
jgi:CheY-like chemotaxis protein